MVVKFKYVVKHFISVVDSLPRHEKLSVIVCKNPWQPKRGNANGNYRRATGREGVQISAEIPEQVMQGYFLVRGKKAWLASLQFAIFGLQNNK